MLRMGYLALANLLSQALSNQPQTSFNDPIWALREEHLEEEGFCRGEAAFHLELGLLNSIHSAASEHVAVHYPRRDVDYK